MPFSAKGLFKDLQINAEKHVADATSDKIDALSRTLGITLPSAVRGKKTAIETPKNGASRDSLLTWDSVSYATGLSGTNFRPKMKCMFKVKFEFAPEFKQVMSDKFKVDPRYIDDFTFAVKSADRPKFNFEYEDDVNKYNFRTKVLKKITHRDLTMAFHDDAGNRVVTMFAALMDAFTPVMRRGHLRTGTLNSSNGSGVDEISGMSFSDDINENRSMRDAFGETAADTGSPIVCIRLQQIFFDNGSDIDTAVKMISFDFMHPQIVAFDLDEVSHEQTDPSSISMTFDYDWLEVVNVGFLGGDNTQYSESHRQDFPGSGFSSPPPTDIDAKKKTGAVASSMGRMGTLPSDSKFTLEKWPGDLMNARNDQGDPSQTIMGRLEAQLKKSATGVLSRGAQTFTSDLIGKGVKAAGGGRFATQIGGVLSNRVGGIAAATVKDIITKNRGDKPSDYAWTPPSRTLDAEPGAINTNSVSTDGTSISTAPAPDDGEY